MLIGKCLACLFSASPELLGFGQSAYRRRSGRTSLVLRQLFDQLHGEGYSMSYTMEDFIRDTARKSYAKMTPQERQEFMESLPLEERLAGLPPEQRLAGLSPEQIQQVLDKLTAGGAAKPRKSRRKK
jgi:hypothetical protein